MCFFLVDGPDPYLLCLPSLLRQKCLVSLRLFKATRHGQSPQGVGLCRFIADGQARQRGQQHIICKVDGGRVCAEKMAQVVSAAGRDRRTDREREIPILDREVASRSQVPLLVTSCILGCFVLFCFVLFCFVATPSHPSYRPAPHTRRGCSLEQPWVGWRSCCRI